MAFATASELAVRLGVTLTPSEEADATALLARATRLVQEEAGQDIELVEDDTLTRRGSWDGRIRLPQRPVGEVSLVKVAGVEVPAAEWYVEGDELVRAYAVAPMADRLLSSNGWGGPEAVLEVTYTHGYDPVPEVAKTACLEAVVRVWVNPGSVRQEGYGTEQVAYQPGNGLFLTEDEARKVREAFKRNAGSVGLR